MQEIDLDWVRTTFPAIFQTFGDSDLARHINAFNDAVRTTPVVDHEVSVLAVKMFRSGIARPHHSIVNLFSETCDPTGAANPLVCRFVAPIVLLEKRLEQLRDFGFRLSEYRTMMVAPHSFDSLIAEVDVVGCLIDSGGSMTGHMLTNEASATNYDVHWTRPDLIVRGDVKYFRDWLRKPDNPIIETINLLLRDDLACGLTVKVGFRELSQEMLIDVALEVLELYRVATGAIPCPEGVRIVTGRNGNGAIASIEASDRLVREVLPMPGTSPNSILVIESGTSSGDEDEDSIRRNLRKAALQVPQSTSDRELAVAFIGSAIPNSVNDVQSALFGRHFQDRGSGEIVHTPGYFSTDTEEVDLKHIQAVLFFSFVYEEVESPPGRMRVRRMSRGFSRTDVLVSTQVSAIRDIEDALSKSTEYEVRFQSSSEP